MGRHDKKITADAQGNLDISKPKDVREAGSGRHSDEDKGNLDQQDGHNDQGQPDDQE